MELKTVMYSVPSLTRVCVSKIVNEIKLFCRGVEFEDLGTHSAEEILVGPLENLCKYESRQICCCRGWDILGY